MCKTCRGYRMIMSNGQLRACPACQGLQPGVISGLPTNLVGSRFSTSRVYDFQAAAYKHALALAQKGAGLLVLLGANGLGKSHLMACVAQRGSELGYASRYATVANLLDELRASYEDNSFDSAWNAIKKVKILLLDELGRASLTDWAKEKLDELVGTRYNEASQTLTILASNYSMATFQPYVRSRLSDQRVATVFNLAGPDLRVALSKPT